MPKKGIELSRETLDRLTDIAYRPTIYSKAAVVNALKTILAAYNERGVKAGRGKK